MWLLLFLHSFLLAALSCWSLTGEASPNLVSSCPCRPTTASLVQVVEPLVVKAKLNYCGNQISSLLCLFQQRFHTKPWFYRQVNNPATFLPRGYDFKPAESKKHLDEADVYSFINSEGKVRTYVRKLRSKIQFLLNEYRTSVPLISAFERQRPGHGVHGELEFDSERRREVPHPGEDGPSRPAGRRGSQVEDGSPGVSAQHEKKGIWGQGAWKGSNKKRKSAPNFTLIWPRCIRRILSFSFLSTRNCPLARKRAARTLMTGPGLDSSEYTNSLRKGWSDLKKKKRNSAK